MNKILNNMLANYNPKIGAYSKTMNLTTHILIAIDFNIFGFEDLFKNYTVTLGWTQ